MTTPTVGAVVFVAMLASLTAACESEQAPAPLSQVDKCINTFMAVFDEDYPNGIGETETRIERKARAMVRCMASSRPSSSN